MDWADLGDPKPRASNVGYTPILWPDGERTVLTQEIPATPDFREVALSRRTRRAFSQLSIEALGALLRLTAKRQQWGSAELGFPVERRPTPSAGAIHPIHLVFAGPGSGAWRRYDPASHELRGIDGAPSPADALEAMQQVVEAPHATLMLLAAEPGKTSSKYESAQSLIWRDAGALLGTLALAAEALDLSFCPLGVTADAWVRGLVDQPGLVGVGAAFVGSTP